MAVIGKIDACSQTSKMWLRKTKDVQVRHIFSGFRCEEKLFLKKILNDGIPTLAKTGKNV